MPIAARQVGARTHGAAPHGAVAVGAVSAAALLCALAMRAAAPLPAHTELSFSFFSTAPASAAASSTFMLPENTAADKYALDLENMQATLQSDSLKPAGVVGDAPNLLAELGDG